MSDILLINESKRTFTLPRLPVPGARTSERGKAIEGTETFMPSCGYAGLAPGARVTVPAWYFDRLRQIKTLSKVFNRKDDGIAVGRTRAEAAGDAAKVREAEAAAELAALKAELAAANAKIAELAKPEGDEGEGAEGEGAPSRGRRARHG